MAATVTPKGSRDLLLVMKRNALHPELGGLYLPPVYPPLPKAPLAYCLDCGRWWSSYSYDELFQDVGWHQTMYAEHVVHVWDAP